MAFWWVNHKKSYIVEIKNNFIWSPKTKRNGDRNHTYINLTLTNPGDIVFSYANGKIGAIGIVADKYRECTPIPIHGFFS